MRTIFKLVITFAVLAVVFSAWSGCGGSGTNTGNGGNAANTNSTNANTQKTGASSSDYPPFSPALADADIELLDGTKSKISDRNKGKVLLVNLWATWCGPCRGEMPHLIAMQTQYADKGFEVLGLDVGDGDGGPESTASMKAFATKMQLNYELGKVSIDTVRKFNELSKFEAIPQTYLIDRQGRLRAVFTSGSPDTIQKMEDNVAKVVAEN